MRFSADGAGGRSRQWIAGGTAASYRDGLLISLLAKRPIWGRNLASILCGQHLVRDGSKWRLVFPATETKNRLLLQFAFPPDLELNLQRYLDVHRPVLLARGERQTGAPLTALWVSKQGTHMGYAAIGHQVRQRTAAAFGKPLSPHLFRDAVATAIAVGAPENVGLIPSILGHTTLMTSERHYNQAGTLEAGRRYGCTITALRQLTNGPIEGETETEFELDFGHFTQHSKRDRSKR